MNRVNQILEHNMYHGCLQQICRLEAGRAFCGHDMAHLLDVARLAYIFNLEEQLEIEKEQIYAAALLHDIGRHIQYTDGTDHHIAGVPIAEEILEDCGFLKREREQILTAVGCHRNQDAALKEPLARILYRADKMSRNCFSCMAEPECNWKPEKKNMKLEY